MSAESAKRRWIPAALGGAMLVLIGLSAFSPVAAPAPPAATCDYGVCPTTGLPTYLWAIGLGILLLIIAAIVAFLLLRRRRGGGVTPVSGGAPPGALGPSEEGEAAAMPPGGGMEPEAGAPAEYIESPEDVGAAPAVPPAAPIPPGSESDIDSLMQELDKISAEILKKGPPKTGSTESTEGTTSSQ